MGKLCEANQGKLYGRTVRGGSNDMGVLFEWDPETNSFSKKLEFNGTETGRSPNGSLILGDNGKLYGTTGYGGIHDKGVLYEWDLPQIPIQKCLTLTEPKMGAIRRVTWLRQTMENSMG